MLIDVRRRSVNKSKVGMNEMDTVGQSVSVVYILGYLESESALILLSSTR